MWDALNRLEFGSSSVAESCCCISVELSRRAHSFPIPPKLECSRGMSYVKNRGIDAWCASSVLCDVSHMRWCEVRMHAVRRATQGTFIVTAHKGTVRPASQTLFPFLFLCFLYKVFENTHVLYFQFSVFGYNLKSNASFFHNFQHL